MDHSSLSSATGHLDDSSTLGACVQAVALALPQGRLHAIIFSNRRRSCCSTQPGTGIDGKATAGPKCCTKHLDLRTTQVHPGKNHFHPQTLICIRVCSSSLPDRSLFMVRFVMTRCSASEFCSQAFTFLGNRRLLVTTVHLGACRRWWHNEIKTGLVVALYSMNRVRSFN